MIHLTVRQNSDGLDSFNVHRPDGAVVGEITMMAHGWAAYRVNQYGRLVIPRIGTFKRIEQAVTEFENLVRS